MKANSPFLTVDYLYTEKYDHLPKLSAKNFSILFERFFKQYQSQITEMEIHPFSDENSMVQSFLIRIATTLNQTTIYWHFDHFEINIMSFDFSDKELLNELIAFIVQQAGELVDTTTKSNK